MPTDGLSVAFAMLIGLLVASGPSWSVRMRLHVCTCWGESWIVGVDVAKAPLSGTVSARPAIPEFTAARWPKRPHQVWSS
jgi:hypothetical protein